ncbi:MAG: MBL fold metallo-hydrolase [Myxococcales bacterium]|nr:MBL fold metallo-hydrolase [Myxococcales bacterium]
MHIEAFFDEFTWSFSYVVHDGSVGAVIDPVRDYDPKSGQTAWESAARIAQYIDRERLRVEYVIDTHTHADHLTGIPFFKERYGALSVIGAGVTEIQKAFRELLGLGPAFPTDGRQFDVLAEEGKRIPFGSLEIEAIHTPGHTPAHMCWKIWDAVFVGDTLFMPDYGTARCDFPGGDAGALYDSIQRLYALPNPTRILVGHDYMPGGRPAACETTVGEQKRSNLQLNENTGREEYIAAREARDKTLAMPNLILPSIQVNIRAGEFPEPEPNGVSYLKIPLNRVGSFAR